ncbi:MAG: GntR family transcriptional regulator [Planctomycetota bacterium]
MILSIDPSAAVPVSEQIAEQIRFAIATGRLEPGEKLPSVRGLARDLLVNPNTVAKVYRDLEREGILRTRPGSGAFVADDAGESCVEESRRIAAEALSNGVTKGVAAGMKAKEIRELVTRCLGRSKNHV